MTLSKIAPKSQFRPLGKMHQIFSQCNKRVKLFPMLKYRTLELKYTLMIVHPSYISQTYIPPFEIKHYHSIYQNGVEVVIVCSLKVILTYKSWEFQLKIFEN